MDYQKAKDIRGKSLSSLITDNIVSGGGIGSSISQALSDRSKARMTGIKEKFDPLNIVKALTGGSRLAPALLGRLTGRSPEAIRYFTKDPKKRESVGGISSQDLSGATQKLGTIYKMMVKMEEEKKLDEADAAKKLMAEQKEEDSRNKQLIKALTARIRPKKKAKKEPEEKKQEQQQKTTEKKQEQSQKKTEKKEEGKVKEKEKEVKKEEKAKKETIKKAEEKKPEVVPPKEVKPKPTAKPEAPPAAKPPTAKPTVAPAGPAISTAAKIGAIAVSATGIFSSSDAFSKTMYPYAEKASKGLGGKIPPVAILGQWSGESGGGKNLPSDFNYAGIKAGKNDKKGDYVLTEERYTDAQIKQAEASGETLHKVLGPQDKIKKKGREVTVDEWFGKGSYDKALSEGKKWVQVKSYFAKFDNFEDFTNRYISFLSSPRYAKARESTTPAQFGSEVAKAGYATASADKYSAKVANFAESFTLGDKINSASTENRELKKDMKDTAPAPVIVNNNTTNQTKKDTPMPAAGGDDRSAYAKKVN